MCAEDEQDRNGCDWRGAVYYESGSPIPGQSGPHPMCMQLKHSPNDEVSDEVFDGLENTYGFDLDAYYRAAYECDGDEASDGE